MAIQVAELKGDKTEAFGARPALKIQALRGRQCPPAATDTSRAGERRKLIGTDLIIRVADGYRNIGYNHNR